MISNDNQRHSRDTLIHDIRTSLRQYPAKKEKILVYLLKCYTLTLEVFLHKQFGERYLTWFRSIVGFGLLYILAHIVAPWYWVKSDYIFKPGFSLFGEESSSNSIEQGATEFASNHFRIEPNGYFFKNVPDVSQNEWSIIPFKLHTKESRQEHKKALHGHSKQQNATVSSRLRLYYLHWEWQPVFKFFGITISIPIFANIEAAGVQLLSLFLLIYSAFASWGSWEIFIRNRQNNPPSPRSSGEPYSVWNVFYYLFYKTNFQTDLVKQFCEPFLCFLVGVVVLVVFPSSPARKFFSFWLISGSVALYLKAYLENCARKDLYLDRIGNEMDLEALRMQQRFLRPKSGGLTFSEARSPNQRP